MSAMIDESQRLALRDRPTERVAGYHHWSDLLFVHWRVPSEILTPLVPRGLTLDTFDGDAWLGVVAFHMSGVRPRWFPALPGVSAFHETNLRTYVHLDGREPGVLFLSLDAANSLAVRVARWRWKLPYYRAKMSIAREADHIHYRSRRLWPEPSVATTDLAAELGAPFAGDTAMHSPHSAAPGTLEFFLIERYLLYAAGPRGGLYRAQVHHPPYSLRHATLTHARESLAEAVGIPINHPPCHTMFCKGVHVEVFPLRRIDGKSPVG